MRRVSLLAAASLLVTPVVSQAKPLNELLVDKGGVLGAAKDAQPAHVYYKDGTKLEFPDAGVDMTLNLRLQSVYTYNDYETLEDNSDFSIRNVRLDWTAHLLNKEFTVKFTNNFVNSTDSGASGSAVEDAYIEWNACPECNLRFGQTMTNTGRQWQTENQNLQFIDRSNVSDFFTLGRQEGLMFHGALGDIGYHHFGVYNGTTIGEGQNLPGNDTKVLAVYDISLDLMGDYDRSYEGDPYNTDGSLGWGASAYFGQAAAGIEEDAPLVDYDLYGASTDIGWRAAGWSVQVEGYYRGINFDVDGGDETIDDFGLYAQAGWAFVPEEWELAARYGYIDLDNDAPADFSRGSEGGLGDKQHEVNVVVNYYLNGHGLKLQTGPSWVINKVEDGDDLTDFRYQVGLFGYL